MSSNSKPRTTRKPKNGKNGSKSNNSTESNTFIDAAYNAISELSLPQKFGLGISAVALISSAIVLRSKNQPRNKNGKGTKGGKGNVLNKKYEQMTPFGMGGRGGRSAGRGGMTRSAPRKKAPTKKGDKLEKIKTEHVTQLFQTCLSSKRPQQQMIADQFYEEINSWSSDQLEVAGQTIVVNFLFWYYRSMNVPETKFHSEQAEHIRYWADYKTTKDVKWDFYNIKFDYMYSTALLQRSIPHMKKFYQWICNETARATPDDASSRKPNYYLTRYQAACILGDWDDGVRAIGQIIKDISSKATTSTATRNDYFMHYTLRALELPASNPNFGLMFKIVNKLQEEFPADILPPPVFSAWNILSFRYKNTDKTITLPSIDQDFIFATEKIRDEEGFYKFYPQQTSMTARINKKINIWGRVCQMVSPVFGAAGFLPLTGSWSDTKVYMQTNWTYRGSGNRLVRKHVIMKIEREPIEKEIESKDYFGKIKKETGYEWKGHITIHMKKLKQGITLRNIYDDEGEEYFDGEAAIQKKLEKQQKQKEKQEETKNNNDDDKTHGNGVTDEDEIETQIYEVELIISKEDPSANDKDKDLKKRILTAMNSASTSTTPR